MFMIVFLTTTNMIYKVLFLQVFSLEQLASSSHSQLKGIIPSLLDSWNMVHKLMIAYQGYIWHSRWSHPPSPKSGSQMSSSLPLMTGILHKTLMFLESLNLFYKLSITYWVDIKLPNTSSPHSGTNNILCVTQGIYPS